MEILKKKVRLKTTTGTTTGGTVIIPDTTVSYNFKIYLNSNPVDIGYFDTIESSGATGVTVDNTPYTVTGVSISRLHELKKYAKTGNLAKRYFTSEFSIFDGVNESLTTEGDSDSVYVYYLSGITYTDTTVNSATTTTYSFESIGYGSDNFENFTIYKDENKQFIVDKPKVSSDVKIVRETLSVFEDQYRIGNIKSVAEFEYYAGGAHFKIINNT
jgi:hypothetical protein